MACATHECSGTETILSDAEEVAVDSVTDLDVLELENTTRS